MFSQKTEDGPIDLLGCLPHGNVATVLDDSKSGTPDCVSEARPDRGWENEVSLSPDEKGGVANAGKMAFPLYGLSAVLEGRVQNPGRSLDFGELILAIDEPWGNQVHIRDTLFEDPLNGILVPACHCQVKKEWKIFDGG